MGFEPVDLYHAPCRCERNQPSLSSSYPNYYDGPIISVRSSNLTTTNRYRCVSSILPIRRETLLVCAWSMMQPFNLQPCSHLACMRHLQAYFFNDHSTLILLLSKLLSFYEKKVNKGALLLSPSLLLLLYL